MVTDIKLKSGIYEHGPIRVTASNIYWTVEMLDDLNGHDQKIFGKS